MPIYSYELPDKTVKRIGFPKSLTEEGKAQAGVEAFGEGTRLTVPVSPLQRASRALLNARPYSEFVAPEIQSFGERAAQETGIPSRVFTSLIPTSEEELAIPFGMGAGGRVLMRSLPGVPRLAQWLGQILGGTSAAAGTAGVTGRSVPDEATKAAISSSVGATAGQALGPLRRHGPPLGEHMMGKRAVSNEMAGDIGQLVKQEVPEFGAPRTGAELQGLFGSKLWRELLSTGYGNRLRAIAEKLPSGMDTIVAVPTLQQKLPPVLREVVERIESPVRSTRTVQTFRQPDIENLPPGISAKDLGVGPESTTTVTNTVGGTVTRPPTRQSNVNTQAVTTREGELMRKVDLLRQTGPETRIFKPLTLAEAEQQLDALSKASQWGADSPGERAIMAREAFWKGRDEIREALREHGGDALANEYNQMNQVYKAGTALVGMYGNPSQYGPRGLMTGETQLRLKAGRPPQGEDWQRRLGEEWARHEDVVFRGANKPVTIPETAIGDAPSTALTQSDVEGLGIPGIVRLYAIETPTGIKARAGLAAPHRSVFPRYIAAPGRKPLEPQVATKDIVSVLTELGLRRGMGRAPESPAVP